MKIRLIFIMNYPPHPNPLLKEREFAVITPSPSGEGTGG